MALRFSKTFRDIGVGMALGVLIPAGLIWFGLWFWADQHYRKYIPEQVPILIMTSQRSEGWYSACGGAIFSMSPAESARLRREGLAAFEGGTVGRGYVHTRRRSATWAPWQETTTRADLGEGPRLGLSCLRSPLQDRIVDALMRPGSYTTWGVDRQLIVIPDLNIVVFLFDD